MEAKMRADMFQELPDYDDPMGARYGEPIMLAL